MDSTSEVTNHAQPITANLSAGANITREEVQTIMSELSSNLRNAIQVNVDNCLTTILQRLDRQDDEINKLREIINTQNERIVSLEELCKNKPSAVSAGTRNDDCLPISKPVPDMRSIMKDELEKQQKCANVIVFNLNESTNTNTDI